jgi:hypothetical protein
MVWRGKRIMRIAPLTYRNKKYYYNAKTKNIEIVEVIERNQRTYNFDIRSHFTKESDFHFYCKNLIGKICDKMGYPVCVEARGGLGKRKWIADVIVDGGHSLVIFEVQSLRLPFETDIMRAKESKIKYEMKFIKRVKFCWLMNRNVYPEIKPYRRAGLCAYNILWFNHWDGTGRGHHVTIAKQPVMLDTFIKKFLEINLGKTDELENVNKLNPVTPCYTSCNTSCNR